MKYLKFLLIVAGVMLFGSPAAFAQGGGQLEITFFNVGAGDCILLRQGEHSMWMTMVWVQRLSRNQPVLKTAVKSKAPVPAAPQAPPAARGQTAK